MGLTPAERKAKVANHQGGGESLVTRDPKCQVATLTRTLAHPAPTHRKRTRPPTCPSTRRLARFSRQKANIYTNSRSTAKRPVLVYDHIYDHI